MADGVDRDDEGQPEKREPRPHRGRSRLSSLDLLPEEAQEDLAWARVELALRKRTQAEILHELNGRLADKDLDLISKNAFNRASIGLAVMNRRLSEARAIFEGVAPQLTPERIDDNTAALGEFIRLLIFEMVQDDGAAIGPKGAMELANAHLAVIRASSVSSDRRRKLEEEFKAKAAAEVEKVADRLGLSTDVRQGINFGLFGAEPPKPRKALP